MKRISHFNVCLRILRINLQGLFQVFYGLFNIFLSAKVDAVSCKKVVVVGTDIPGRTAAG